MKAIMVMFDSLNRHYLPSYGCEWTHAPNFKRLAEKTVTFDNFYAGSLPCMPARRELHTGRYNFLHRSWGPMEPYDDSMPEILAENDIHSHLISDHSHYWEDGGATYHTRYSAWEAVRGQEGDPWKGQIEDPYIPEFSIGRKNFIWRQNSWRQDWVNRQYEKTYEEMPSAKTFQLGLDFLERNHNADNWFLQIESFDPHEPFYAPQEFRDLYPHEYNGPHFDWPIYKEVDESPDIVEHEKFVYAALLSMCDKNLGRVLDFMDEHKMWDDTMLIVNCDHGFLLGEHGWWAKNLPPFYEEIAHLPFFMYDPRNRIQGVRTNAFAQTIDIAPTLYEFFDVPMPDTVQGKSLQETLAHSIPTRKGGLFGLHGGQVNYTDGRYVYMRGPRDQKSEPLFEYTLMPTRLKNFFSSDELKTAEIAPPFSFTKEIPLMRTKSKGPAHRSIQHTYGNLLFDLESDPKQEHPLDDPALEARMIAEMVALMQHNDAPLEQYTRLGLEDYLPATQI